MEALLKCNIEDQFKKYIINSMSQDKYNEDHYQKFLNDEGNVDFDFKDVAAKPGSALEIQEEGDPLKKQNEKSRKSIDLTKPKPLENTEKKDEKQTEKIENEKPICCVIDENARYNRYFQVSLRCILGYIVINLMFSAVTAYSSYYLVASIPK
ncbi:hypothetical protein pb186bvf_020258 [Paramecium bursaria]